MTIKIEIDGNEVSLTGSRKGDGVFEALKGTAWKWGRPTGGFVLPRNLLPHTRDRNVQLAKSKLTAAGRVEGPSPVRRGLFNDFFGLPPRA